MTMFGGMINPKDWKPKLRKCSNCFKEKPISEFYVKRWPSYRDGQGFQSRCKACNAEVVRGYHKRKREREKGDP